MSGCPASISRLKSRGKERPRAGCSGLLGWEAIAQPARMSLQHKDLLDSRSVVYDPFTLSLCSDRGFSFLCPSHFFSILQALWVVQCPVILMRAVSAYLISKVTRCPYVRRSGGAPASHLAQDSKRPMALDLPSAVMTHGRLLHGG
jgi:hypothetical protein